eukprot:TRINITY_DN70954_c0_g1_i1.p1 TRINITY_DN70954_c0_g1~~TRINITY_DN70954_c0_g1_i1.p1  ORF type:complete len:312 (-),score=61.65 TRINITY_DN70954_c0_g1_i1:46-981(-)
MGEAAACPDSVVLTIVSDGEESEEDAFETVPPAALPAVPSPPVASPRLVDGQSSEDSRLEPDTSASHAEQEEHAREWEVQLHRNGEELGIDVLQHETDNLRVNKIKAGVMWRWNAQNPGLAVRPGDRIFSVNGQRGNAEELISAIRGCEDVRLGVRRVTWLRLDICRQSEGAPLGIDVASHSNYLRILNIRRGPFQDYNSSVSFERRVHPSDQVWEVNGTRGKSDALLQAIRSAGQRISFLVKVSERCELDDEPSPHRRRLPRERPREEYDEGDGATPVTGQHPRTETPSLQVETDCNEPPAGHCTLQITP